MAVGFPNLAGFAFHSLYSAAFSKAVCFHSSAGCCRGCGFGYFSFRHWSRYLGELLHNYYNCTHTHEHTPGVPPLHDVQVNHGLVERHSTLYDFTTSFNHYVHEILVAFGPCPSLRLSPKSIWGDIFRHDSINAKVACIYLHWSRIFLSSGLAVVVLQLVAPHRTVSSERVLWARLDVVNENKMNNVRNSSADRRSEAHGYLRIYDDQSHSRQIQRQIELGENLRCLAKYLHAIRGCFHARMGEEGLGVDR